jgi:hypothetical protein
MYSPKIRPEIVRELYHIRKAEKVPMTKIVNEVLEDYLIKRRCNGEENDNSNSNKDSREGCRSAEG